jgi:hypothetical protein
MASVRTNDNNTKGIKGNVFDSCNYEGEYCFDTRNTRKQVNGKKDPQKVKWQARHDYYEGWKPVSKSKLSTKSNANATDGSGSDDGSDDASDDGSDDSSDDDADDGKNLVDDTIGFNPTDSDKKVLTRHFRRWCVKQDKKAAVKGSHKRATQMFFAKCSM